VSKGIESIDLSPGGARFPWHWVTRILGVLALVAFALLLGSAWRSGALQAWMGGARPIPFFLAVAVLPAFGVPMTPLFILAGATFGRWLGLAGSLIALALNLTGCYWIARSGMRRWLVVLLSRFGYQLPDLTQNDKRTRKFVVTMKVTPGLPAFVKTYALGAAGVPFGLFFFWSMLITGAYVAALALFGASLLEHRPGPGVVAAVVLLGMGIVVWWWRKR
jgi:uncharacterized membrane protein YdjX (TVP38/TMEM64 family)